MTTPKTHNTPLHEAKRIVIKVGSLLLINPETNTVYRDWLRALVTDIAWLHRQGKEIIIVSSGAVALGRHELSLTRERLSLAEKRAAAACGQITLAEAWQTALFAHGLNVALMLLTTEDTEDRRRYLNGRSTVDTLMKLGVIPIINENDSITTDEIRYGDNDRLAARVASMASADLVVLLSDIDGLYTADPKINPKAEFIERVDAITDIIRSMAGESADHRTSGGMKTKLQAATIATSSGCQLMIAKGTILHPLQAIMDGGRHTLFVAHEDPMSARKHWIANSVNTYGTLTVDEGAQKALLRGNSLLPSGVVAVEGEFTRGDTVRIINQAGEVLALGLIAYPKTAASLIRGKKSDQIEAILGFKWRDEMVHRDDLVLTYKAG